MRVRSGRAELRCEALGRGKPLVLLHAGVCDRRSFRASLPNLAAEYRAVAYDRRGFGETTYASERFGHVEDLLAVIDAMDAERVALVGHSQGARIATDFALSYPARVACLLLVAPAISGAPALAAHSESEAALEAAIEAAETAGDLELVNRLEARLWLDGPKSPEGRVTGEARRLFLDMNGRALRAASPGEELAPPPAFDRVSALQAPVHIMLGELDRGGIDQRGRLLAERAPNATLTTLAGVAHLPPLERPDEFARHVLRALR